MAPGREHSLATTFDGGSARRGSSGLAALLAASPTRRRLVAIIVGAAAFKLSEKDLHAGWIDRWRPARCARTLHVRRDGSRSEPSVEPSRQSIEERYETHAASVGLAFGLRRRGRRDLAVEREGQRLRAAEDVDLLPLDLVGSQFDPTEPPEKAGKR